MKTAMQWTILAALLVMAVPYACADRSRAHRDDATAYFYEELAPHGDWMTIDRYGWVWRPEVSRRDRSWRPYCDDGNWESTEDGWSWCSDYTWGWAPFHYGRWVYSRRHRWLWVPDLEWGASWVSWRSTDTHWGWAPLPPEVSWRAGYQSGFRGRHGSVDFRLSLSDSDYIYVPYTQFLAESPSRYVEHRGYSPRRYGTTCPSWTGRIDNNGLSVSYQNPWVHLSMGKSWSRPRTRHVDYVVPVPSPVPVHRRSGAATALPRVPSPVPTPLRRTPSVATRPSSSRSRGPSHSSASLSHGRSRPTASSSHGRPQPTAHGQPRPSTPTGLRQPHPSGHGQPHPSGHGQPRPSGHGQPRPSGHGQPHPSGHGQPAPAGHGPRPIR